MRVTLLVLILVALTIAGANAQKMTTDMGGDIKFANNSNKLFSSSLPVLDKIAIKMQKEKQLTIKITGRYDDQSIAKQRPGLAKQRAEAVKEYLVTKGIESERIKIVDSGEPVTPNKEGRKNQVDIEFVNK